MKKIISLIMVCSLLICSVITVNFNAGTEDTYVQSGANAATMAAAANTYGLANNVQDGVMLHAWNWSYNTIKEQMPLIAASGYSAVQTSPVTQPKDYTWQGMVGTTICKPGEGSQGNWWKVYQPVTMSICDNGETWFGTKAEFEAMCQEAHKYGIKVIVDIVANHMGNITGWKNSMSDISPQVGEFWNSAMMTDTSYWHINNIQIWHSDGRRDVTQGTMGMPDLNTQDKKVQNMVLDLLVECINSGADGFRFDAAKHIEMPEDDANFAGDFWPTVLNGARTAYKTKTGRDLYVYGEILNRIDELNPTAYTKRMSVTDNSAGDQVLNSARYGNAGGMTNSSYSGYVDTAEHAVLWAESHDTYAGGPSNHANDEAVKQAWAIVGTRKGATALYFARPFKFDDYYNKSMAQLPDLDMGEIGTMYWADKSIQEVNKFHNYFIGKSESLGNSGSVAYNVRGGEGVVISKLDGKGSVDLSSNGMKDGTYKDQVSGNTFTVSGGRIKGTVGSNDGIAVVYNATAKPANTISQAGGKFATDTLNVTIGLENAVSGTYQIDNGAVTTYTGSTTVTLGKGIANGDKTVLKLTATSGSITTEISYTFTKDNGTTTPATTEATEATTAPTTTPPVTEQVLLGDVNMDGNVDIKDATLTQRYIASLAVLNSKQQLAADVNESKSIDIKDVTVLQRHIASYATGTRTGEYITINGSETTEPSTPATDPTTNTTEATTEPLPPINYIYYKNTNNWSNVYAYYWVKDSQGTVTWPGVEMHLVKDNIYRIEVPEGMNQIIFSNQGSSQTGDLTIPGWNQIYDNGNWSAYTG